MAHYWKALLALTTGLSLLTAAACSGGGSVDDTAREISNEQLAQMVLALEQFGPEYAAFTPQAENGVKNLDTASADDFDAADERADLERASFVSAYEVNFLKEAVEGAPFFLGSEVYLFASADGATTYLKDSEAELTENAGRTSEGSTIEAINRFEVKAGDEALGANADISVRREDGSSTGFWLTVVEFRRGRLAGDVRMFGMGLSDIDKVRLQGKVEALAAVMNERVSGALAVSAETAAPVAAGQ